MPLTPRQTSKPTRRAVLQAGIGWAAVPSITTLARAAGADRDPDRTLVLLHLSGGNDGLNTIIPYADPLYYELRPRLSRAARGVLAVNSQVGFHASLSALVPLFQRGRLAIVQGVGYASPDYSHVGSCRIWATGRMDASSDRGWWDLVLERLLRRVKIGAVYVGEASPAVLATTRLDKVHIVNERANPLSPTANPAEYCPGRIERTLATVARLVGSASPPALVLTAVGGFDTHADQLESHEQVLRELGDGLAAFQRKLEERAVAERVLLMAWSEFGRRPAENAMGGTDHGSAGPVFLLGKKIRGGLYGQKPSLQNTDFGNLIPTVDFRMIYATLVKRWLNYPAGAIAGMRRSLSFL